MAFGSSVTNLSQYAIGSAGYIVKINTAELLAETIEAIQAQASPSSTPAPVSGPTSVSNLFSYLNSSEGPDLAFSSSDGECNVFFNTTTFPYSATTRYALFGKRKPQNCVSDSEYLDLPDRDLNLLFAYCMEMAYAMKKGGTLKGTYERIKVLERAIRGE